MGWVRLGRDVFQVDDEGAITDVVNSQYEGDVHWFELVALFAEPGESLDSSKAAAWDVVRLGADTPLSEIGLRLGSEEAERIAAARERAPIADSVSLSELEELLSAAKAETAGAGFRTDTSFARSTTGHDLVFLIITAAADGTAAIATTAQLRLALHRVQAKSRVKRLAGREAEAISRVRSFAGRDVKGAESWVAGKMVLDESEGAFSVTLLHPDDLDLAEANARWVRYRVTPTGQWLDLRRIESNRVDF